MDWKIEDKNKNSFLLYSQLISVEGLDNRYDKVFQFDKLPFYLQCIFKFYLFFGLFDYRKMESNEEVASYQSNANLNSNNINSYSL